MSKKTIYLEDAINALHNEIVKRRISEDVNDDGSLDEFDTESILRRLPSAQPELIMCKDCKFADREATSSNGMYWCIFHGSYMRYCSDATRRTDADMRGEQDG